ncbi:MAG: DNA methyltransferase, partial [Bacteroidia bacterium]|nr:DNA methyltransferase [Bacteroidia bacterium]
MSKEQLFYQTLQDIFIGAEVEGKGGFIKLMRIKSKYYKRIEDLLKADINQRLERYPSFREELFDKLYTFFKYYFAENGSIYFNQTSFHNNIYEKVYSNEKDIVLFWKTQMLYYVKTDRIFRSMPIEIDNLSFFFDASTIENKKANEKRSLIYSLKEVKTEGYNEIIVFEVLYAEKGRVTPIEDILKGLKKYKIKITEEQLERAFRIFERQAEVDYFIHKNAKAFLQEQFKLWLYQYYWQGAEYWHVERVNQLQILKDIAFKIIDFIAQFEDELVKIWNKPKFVKNSHYVITLDRIAAQPSSTQVLQKIVQHPNVHKQVEEWQKLEMVPQTFNIDDIFVHNLIDQPQISLKPEYQFLPIDTHYFKDIEQDILALFSDLDNSLDGWLIKSENYQALNTLLPKFKNKVQTIYIDPPFNLDNSTQFLYNTNYKDSTWATLLENRIRIAKEWLNEKGSIFVRCDY